MLHRTPDDTLTCSQMMFYFLPTEGALVITIGGTNISPTPGGNIIIIHIAARFGLTVCWIISIYP